MASISSSSGVNILTILHQKFDQALSYKFHYLLIFLHYIMLFPFSVILHRHFSGFFIIQKSCLSLLPSLYLYFYQSIVANFSAVSSISFWVMPIIRVGNRPFRYIINNDSVVTIKHFPSGTGLVTGNIFFSFQIHV